MPANAAVPSPADIPSDASILERALSLCSEACYMVALQRRRLSSVEPEDEVFVFRWWADLQFLIVALYRLRRGAQIAGQVSNLGSALSEFDTALPGLKTLRDIGEHIEHYAVDSPKRHNLQITRRALQVGSWDGTVFHWLGVELDVVAAQAAADRCFLAVKSAVGKHIRS